MIKNDNDLLRAVFDASAFLADILARYTSIEVHYRDCQLKDRRDLEDAVVDVYLAVLNYSAAVIRANNANVASKRALQALNQS